MKVRTGFVSNSSSSSFVAIGFQVDSLDDLTTEDLHKFKDVFCEGYNLSANEGQTLVHINSAKMLKFVKENAEKIGIGTIFKAVYTGGNKINKKDLPVGDLAVFTTQQDHYSPSTTEDLQRYLLS